MALSEVMGPEGDLPVAKTIEDAEKFFLGNSSGSLVCKVNGYKRIVECYPEAEEFFNTNTPAFYSKN